MSDKKRETIIRMVKKALALSEGAGTQEESQNALLNAQRIMAQYNLSMSEVGGGYEPKKEVSNEVTFDEGKVLWWHGRLSIIIGKNFKCEPYYSTVKNNEKSQKVIRFIGLKEDVELARYVFMFALDMIKFHSNYHVKYERNLRGAEAKAVTNDYIMGYLNGLQDKFDEQVNKNNWGLILVKDALVEKAVADLHLKPAKRQRINMSGDSEARSAGYNEGKNFETGSTRALKG